MAKRRKNQQQKAQAANAQTQPQNSQSSDGTGAQKPGTTGTNGQAQPAQKTTNKSQESKSNQQDLANANDSQCCKQCGRNHQLDGVVTSEEGDDPMMVQPKFNISETVEVVHMGPSGQQHQQQQQFKGQNKQGAAAPQTQAQRFAAANQQPGNKAMHSHSQQPQTSTGPQKQGTWNQPNQTMTGPYHKRQYHQGSEPYGKQPVVTMHDLIDQEERQASEQQKAQRQQQQQQQQQQAGAPQQTAGSGQPGQPQPVQNEDMGVDADDEEGEEESEDEDTEEEGIYGPEEGHEDDLSDEIEDEHQWASQAQATQAQYRQPGQNQGTFQGQQTQPGSQTQGYQQTAEGSQQQYYNAQQHHSNQGNQTQYQQHSQQYSGNNGPSSNANNSGQSQQPNQQPGYHQQPPHQQSNNSQQPQQNQQPQQSQQRTQTQQTADSVENRLHQFLTDMLINLYNGKGTEEYRDHYAQVVNILDEQKKIQEANREQPVINIQTLTHLFQTKIENIVGTVRDKLQEDAKKDNLVEEIEVQQTVQEVANPQSMQDSASQGARRQATPTASVTIIKQPKVKEYRGDLQKNFDEILSAVGDYFDLFKNNTDKLEALWLQLLRYVDVKNTNKCQIFRQLHYSIYINAVIKNKTISAIIKEASRWNGSPHASKALKDHLEKIKQIESNKNPIPETYENFNRQSLDFDLNEYTRTDFLQKQQQERQQQLQQQQQRQAQANNEGAKSTNAGGNVTCQNAYHDCASFQTHQRQTQKGGQCMCRCYAKNCAMDHFGSNAGKNGQRNGQQKRGNDKRNQGKRGTETAAQAEQFDYADEQVYNKNLDDLMDYILQPQQDGKKNKKKQKKRKGANEDGDEEPVKTSSSTKQPCQTSNMPNNTQQSSSSSGAKSQPPNHSPVNSNQQHQQPSSVGSGGGANATSNNTAGTKTRKQQSQASSGQEGAQDEREGAHQSKNRSQSRPSKPSSEKNSMTMKNNQQESRDSNTNGRQRGKRGTSNGYQGDSQPIDSGTGSSDIEDAEEPDQQKCDPQFEAQLKDFARGLERSCAQKLANHARKLRPNYEEQWILKLKLRLQTLESKKQPASSTSSSTQQQQQSSGKASGHRSKN